VTIAVRPRSTIRFRGRSFLALVLAPEVPLKDWLNGVDTVLAQSPGFFAERPIIVDISGLKISKRELAALVADLHERGIRIMALEGADSSLIGLGLPPPISGGKPAGVIDVPDMPGAAPAEAPAVSSAGSLLIEGSVRSGQAIVQMEGDVTVLGSVASGAEVIAGGSIHVYGALRGRAIAGLQTGSTARIFCRKLEAELVAVDGLYRTAEHWGEGLHGRAVQIQRNRGALSLSALD
jgi:septum site-determining protein MinC